MVVVSNRAETFLASYSRVGCSWLSASTITVLGRQTMPGRNWLPSWATPLLCADLGLTLEPRDNCASCIATWLTDSKMTSVVIFSAAAYAQNAMDCLHDLEARRKPRPQRERPTRYQLVHRRLDRSIGPRYHRSRVPNSLYLTCLLLPVTRRRSATA
jgi:hypothetical protein